MNVMQTLKRLFFDSLEKRVLVIYGLLFLVAVVLTNLLAWEILRVELLKAGKIRLEIWGEQIEGILKDAYFSYSLGVLRTKINPKELLIVEKKKALEELERFAEEVGIKYVVIEGSKRISGNAKDLSSEKGFILKTFYFEPFQWRIQWGLNQKDLLQHASKTFVLYFSGLSFLIMVSLVSSYFAYRQWLRRPIQRVISSLEKGEKLQFTGIKEIDLLIDRINQALEREKEWIRNLAVTEKMSALGVLAGGYAHEFNNLLQIISGHLKLAQVWIERGEEVKALERLKEAEKAALRGAEISRRILRLARRQPHKKDTLLPVDKVVSATIEALKKAFPKDIKIELLLEKDLFVPLGEEELQEVLLNLCLNARDAMGESGRLTIRAYAKGDRVVIEVEDTGCGIPKEILTRVFEPFFTTKEPGKGTGLGLFIVHQLVTEAGGSVQVESKEGVGTKFVIELPRIRPEAVRVSEEVPTPKVPSKAVSGKIMVVDDEEEIRENLREFFEIEGFKVETASSAEEALKKLQADEEVKVIFVDLIMPGKNGLWLVKEVERRFKEPPAVILMTGFAGEFTEDVERFVEKGRIVRILRKPFQLSELKSLLEEVLK